MSENIQIYDNFLSDDEIDNLLKNLEVVPYQESGTGNDPKSISSFNPTHRRSQIKWIPKKKPFIDTYKKISSFVKKANKDMFRVNLTYCENIQFTKYNESDWGTYNWHIDTVALQNEHDKNKVIRKLSTVIFLNDEDDFTGGNFLIDISGSIQHIKQKKGTMIIFTSNTSHCVTPVIYGNRKSLVNWFSGPPEI